MKYNPIVSVFGVWWVVEVDKSGKKWAVHGSERVSLKDLFQEYRAMIDATHACRKVTHAT